MEVVVKIDLQIPMFDGKIDWTHHVLSVKSFIHGHLGLSEHRIYSVGLSFFPHIFPMLSWSIWYTNVPSHSYARFTSRSIFFLINMYMYIIIHHHSSLITTIDHKRSHSQPFLKHELITICPTSPQSSTHNIASVVRLVLGPVHHCSRSPSPSGSPATARWCWEKLTYITGWFSRGKCWQISHGAYGYHWIGSRENQGKLCFFMCFLTMKYGGCPVKCPLTQSIDTSRLAISHNKELDEKWWWKQNVFINVYHVPFCSILETLFDLRGPIVAKSHPILSHSVGINTPLFPTNNCEIPILILMLFVGEIWQIHIQFPISSEESP